MYDILVMCLLRAINKWDPYYTDKVRKVVNAIDIKFPSRKQFTAFQLSSELGFNGTSIVRMLAHRGFPEPTAAARGSSAAGKESSMKSLPEVVALLQCTQETLEPVLASLHQQDYSELFLSVAPGLTQKGYILVQRALRRIVQQGWYAGRRGRVSKCLIDALGSLQQTMHAADLAEATWQAVAAAEYVRQALADCHAIGARPRRRQF